MNIALNTTHKIAEKHFRHAVSGTLIEEVTDINIKITDKDFILNFNCLNNPFVDENTFTDDNSDLFKQEVFELFIASGTESPTKYLEIEINPNGALFAAYIENEDKIGSNLKSQMIDKENSGIVSMVEKESDSWSGELIIPIKLITEINKVPTNDYRLNFFRIISKKSHTNSDWSNNPEDCIYTCWKSTHSPLKPKFHRTEYFGRLHVDN